MLARLGSIINHIKMSTAHVHNTNTACCSIPPVLSDYTPKGIFRAFGAFDKVYVTGPENHDTAIVCVYDIFGYFPQTQQGADIIASTLKTTVYMPDFFNGKPYPLDKFPPSTDQEKADFQTFWGGIANIPNTLGKLTKFGETLKAADVKRVGVYGFCWGGKVTVSASSDSTPFDAASIVHPAMLSVDDAAKLKIPLAMYISKDEPVDEFNKINEVIATKPFAAKNDSKIYANMHHGWAAARADLNNAENKKEFEDVYTKLVTFFQNTLN